MSDEVVLGVGAAGVGAGVVALAGKLVYDVMGPGAKNLGDIWRDYQDYRLRNWLKIGRAAEHLGGEMPDGWSVHPRVASRVIEDGSWLDDDVMQSYAGGVIAASKSPDGSDDQGAFYVRVLTNLTALQTRLHHIIYSRVRARALAYHAEKNSLLFYQWMQEELVFRVDEMRLVLFDIDPEWKNLRVSEHFHEIRDAMHALARDSLISPIGWTYRDSKATGQPLAAILDFEFAVHASQLGLNLFLWGHGAKTSDINALTYPQYVWEFDPPGPTLD